MNNFRVEGTRLAGLTYSKGQPKGNTLSTSGAGIATKSQSLPSVLAYLGTISRVPGFISKAPHHDPCAGRGGDWSRFAGKARRNVTAGGASRTAAVQEEDTCGDWAHPPSRRGLWPTQSGGRARDRGGDKGPERGRGAEAVARRDLEPRGPPRSLATHVAPAGLR